MPTPNFPNNWAAEHRITGLGTDGVNHNILTDTTGAIIISPASTSNVNVNYPITGYHTNPNNLSTGTLVAIPAEPGGTPIGLLLSLTLASTEYYYGIIAGNGASYIKTHS